MKIGILGTRGIPNNYGGFEQFAEHLSKGLIDKGCEVFVYNSHNHPYKKDEWEGVKIIHKYDPEYIMGLSGQFIYDFNCIIDSRKRDFDILLQLGYTTNSIWSFLLPRKARKICNPDGMEWKRSKYPGLVKKFLKYAEKLAVKSNELLIADSEVIKDYFIEKYNTKTIYSGYPAEVFTNHDDSILSEYSLQPNNYNILIARLQPDNNSETILQGVKDSKNKNPFLVIGNSETKYGKYLKEKFNDERIIFLNAVYNQDSLNNLRYYSHLYFHGHSAGGTNPSLLEAMASSALICAHNNQYNKSVLKTEAFYFSSSSEISELLNNAPKKQDFKNRIDLNINKIETKYSPQKIINDYYEAFTEVIKTK